MGHAASKACTWASGRKLERLESIPEVDEDLLFSNPVSDGDLVDPDSRSWQALPPWQQQPCERHVKAPEKLAKHTPDGDARRARGETIESLMTEESLLSPGSSDRSSPRSFRMGKTGDECFGSPCQSISTRSGGWSSSPSSIDATPTARVSGRPLAPAVEKNDREARLKAIRERVERAVDFTERSRVALTTGMTPPSSPKGGPGAAAKRPEPAKKYADINQMREKLEAARLSEPAGVGRAIPPPPFTPRGALGLSASRGLPPPRVTGPYKGPKLLKSASSAGAAKPAAAAQTAARTSTGGHRRAGSAGNYGASSALPPRSGSFTASAATASAA